VPFDFGKGIFIVLAVLSIFLLKQWTWISKAEGRDPVCRDLGGHIVVPMTVNTSHEARHGIHCPLKFHWKVLVLVQDLPTA
jgi:hypothetical protein